MAAVQFFLAFSCRALCCVALCGSCGLQTARLCLRPSALLDAFSRILPACARLRCVRAVTFEVAAGFRLLNCHHETAKTMSAAKVGVKSTPYLFQPL